MATTVLGFKTYIPGTIPLDLANILSVGLGLTYVGSLYLSKNARLSFSSSKPNTTPDAPDQPRDKESNERWRDDPDVIRARLVAVSSATVVCCVGVYALVGYVGAQEEGVCVLFSLFLSFIRRKPNMNLLPSRLSQSLPH